MQATEADTQPDDDEEDEEFSVGGRRQSYRLSELDVPRWRADLQAGQGHPGSRETASRGHHAGTRRQAARNHAGHPQTRQPSPTIDRDGNPNRKLLVFTTFKDTANYLYDNLAGLAAELGFNMAMVSGDETRATAGANNFNAILTNFAPVARNRPGDSAIPTLTC